MGCCSECLGQLVVGGCVQYQSENIDCSGNQVVESGQYYDSIIQDLWSKVCEITLDEVVDVTGLGISNTDYQSVMNAVISKLNTLEYTKVDLLNVGTPQVIPYNYSISLNNNGVSISWNLSSALVDFDFVAPNGVTVEVGSTSYSPSNLIVGAINISNVDLPTSILVTVRGVLNGVSVILTDSIQLSSIIGVGDYMSNLTDISGGIQVISQQLLNQHLINKINNLENRVKTLENG